MPNRSMLMMNVHLQVIEGSLNYNADIDDQYHFNEDHCEKAISNSQAFSQWITTQQSQGKSATDIGIE